MSEDNQEAKGKEANDEQREQKAREMESTLKSSLRSILEPAAYERLMNVAHSNKSLYLVAGKQLLMISQRAGRKITEEELLMILRAIKEKTEKKTSITFHSK